MKHSKFLLDNPGFRISFLNMDLDMKDLHIALNLLYDRIIKGGVIVFDEYAEYDCSETNELIDLFLEHPDLKLSSTMRESHLLYYLLRIYK